MSGNVLSVRGLSKKFAGQMRRSLAYGLSDMAGELFPFTNPPGVLRKGEFWALHDISFDVAPGESLAVIGHNGAGKSTLLKILFGLLKPDRGEVRISGRTEAIIELGTGFNPLLTGRENVEVGAALHGFAGRETKRLLDAVVDFSELEAAIDTPVQSYSSGMKARLSYALSAQLEPDLLLVDEVLAVGDLAFQRKCVGHMRAYLEKGGALLLVSHNTYQIQAVCRRGLMLDSARSVFQGSAVEALNHMFEVRASRAPLLARQAKAEDPLVIEGLSAQGESGGALRTGEAMRVTLSYDCREAVDAAWGFGIWTADQWICITGSYQETGRRIEPGRGSLSCLVPRLPLLPGSYMMRAVLVDPETRFPISLFGWNDPGLPIEVRGDATALTNGQSHLNQLVTIDADWS